MPWPSEPSAWVINPLCHGVRLLADDTLLLRRLSRGEITLAPAVRIFADGLGR